MKSLFIANIEMDENEGIYKKVCAQADAFPSCELITRVEKKAKVRFNNKSVITETPFFEHIFERVDSGDVNEIYIRHMVPDFQLIRLLKLSKNKNIKIYYEIPTYPYFAEQFKASRQKHRAIAKIALDVVFWPVIYKYIDKLIVIRSNTKAKHYAKMLEITNGVRIDNIKSKNHSKNNDEVFRMVAVGTLYPYHGYDRVLKAMAKCEEKVYNKKVEFHIVGSSKTIDDLHREADKLGLNNVIFHGICSTEQLNEMYDEFDVGLGCLALHRRNADIDTTLKVIEYYCRGVPVISSGKCPMKNDSCTFVVRDDDLQIDIEAIYDFYCSIPKEELMSLSEKAKKDFSWENIINNYVRK